MWFPGSQSHSCYSCCHTRAILESCKFNCSLLSVIPLTEHQFVEEQAIDRVHRLTQKIDVVVYKITIKDSVEERILDLQEKKRELANQTIEGGKGGAGKLGMKEILQLFRRDAEHAPPAHFDAGKYDLGKQPRILKEPSNIMTSGSLSREVSVPRKISPTANKSVGAKEDSVYGRRW